MNENEYAVEITKLLIGGWHPQIVNAYSEVPRFSHNDHMDLLLICPKKKEMLSIEFKLNNVKLLLKQIEKGRALSHVDTIGITPTKSIKDSKYVRFDLYRIRTDFPDKELEYAIIKIGRMRWTSIYRSKKAMMYWYSYKNMDNSFSTVGAKGGKRESFFEVYKRAIKNLHNELGDKMSFQIAHGLFGSYSESVAKKHYNSALSELRKNKANEMRRMMYTFSRGNNTKRATMKGRKCRVLARGKMNSALVMFENGQREIVSRNSLRRSE